MEWAIPPNLQHTNGGLQIPTKRKQLGSTWDRMETMIRPTLQASRLPFPTYNPHIEGFQTSTQTSNTIDQALGTELGDFLAKYKEALKVLSATEVPQDTKDFLAYYDTKLKKENGLPVGFDDRAYVEYVDTSNWDKGYVYYRFIFSDPSKCVKSSNTGSPSFTFEFQKLGKPMLATYSDNTSASYMDGTRSFPVVNGTRQKYANGVLLIQLDSADSFSGYSWGADNKGRKATPILSTWLLQASNDSTVWEDLNVADVFNELVQQDTARFDLLGDTRQKGADSGTFNVFSKERMRKDIDLAKRRLLQGLIDKFRVTYINLPPTLQNLLVQQFSQTDLDRSDAMNTNMTKDRLDVLFAKYLQTTRTGAPSAAGAVNVGTQDFVITDMLEAIRSNLIQSIPAIQQASSTCRGPSTGAPTSIISAPQAANDLSRLQTQAMSFQETVALFMRYNDLLNSMTENMSSDSRNAQLRNAGDDAAALFAIPTNLPKESFADKTYNDYREFLTRKLSEFYQKFMFEEVEEGISQVGAPTGAPASRTATRKIKTLRYYTNFYNEDIRDLYKTDRATGISKGRADYLAIWKEREPGTTPETHIAALQELEKTYDTYAAALDASIPIAKQRKQTVDMMDIFKYCYDKIVQKFASVRTSMILEGSVETDRSNALLIPDLSELVALYEKYYGYLYSHSIQGVGNVPENNDLWSRLGNLVIAQAGKEDTTIQTQFRDLYNNVIRPEFTTTYTAYAGKQYNAYKRQIGTEANGITTYREASQTLFQELETTWQLPEKTRPTYVATNLSAYTNYLQSAINTLKTIRVLKKPKSSEFSTDTERQNFSSIDAAMNLFIEWYGYLFAAKDALDPADPSQKGIGFLTRVEQCIELDSIRPRAMRVMQEYKRVYEGALRNMTNITTVPFISKTHDIYDLTDYAVNEMKVLENLQLLDVSDLSGVSLSRSETEIPKTRFDPLPTANPVFDIECIRIAGATLNGNIQVGYNIPGTRITRTSIDFTNNTATFLVAADFSGDVKMVEVIVRYDTATKTIKIKLGNAKTRPGYYSNSDRPDDLTPPTSLWILQNGKEVFDSSLSTSATITLSNLRVGYINFYRNVNADIQIVKTVDIFNKTLFPVNLAPSAATATNATTTTTKVYSDDLIKTISGLQAAYYVVSGGVASGYYANLINFMATMVRQFRTKLQKIHTDFDALLGTTGDGLYNTDWSLKGTYIKHLNRIRYTDNSGTQWEAPFANNFTLPSYAVEDINTKIAPSRVEPILRGASSDILGMDWFQTQLTTVFNVYKPAMYTITQYNYWKGHVRDWIKANKSYKPPLPVARFYEHANYEGTERVLQPGRYTSTDLGSLSGTISSAKITKGFRVYAFESDNFQDKCTILDASGSVDYALPSLTDMGLNDKIKSMFVYFGYERISFDNMYDVYYWSAFSNVVNSELNMFRRETVVDTIRLAETLALANNAKSNLRFLFDKDNYVHDRRNDLITVFTNWFTERQTTEDIKIRFNTKYDTMVSGGYKINQDIPTNEIRNFRNTNFSYTNNSIDASTPVITNRALTQSRIDFLTNVSSAQEEMNKYITKYTGLIAKGIGLGGEITNYQNSFAYTTFVDISGTNPIGPTWNKQNAIDNKAFLDKVDEADVAINTFKSSYNTFIASYSDVLPQFLVNFKNQSFNYTIFDTNIPDNNKINSQLYKTALDDIKIIIDSKIKLDNFKSEYNSLYRRVALLQTIHYFIMHPKDGNIGLSDSEIVNKVKTVYPFCYQMTKSDLQKLRYMNKSICRCGLVKDESTSFIGYASIDGYGAGCGYGKVPIENCAEFVSNWDANNAGIYLKIITNESAINTIITLIKNRFKQSDINKDIEIAIINSESNGKLIVPTTTQSSYYDSTISSYDFKTNINDIASLNTLINTLKTTLNSTAVESCISNINSLYTKINIAYNNGMRQVKSDIESIRAKLWFKLSKRPNITSEYKIFNNVLTNNWQDTGLIGIFLDSISVLSFQTVGSAISRYNVLSYGYTGMSQYGSSPRGWNTNAPAYMIYEGTSTQTEKLFIIFIQDIDISHYKIFGLQFRNNGNILEIKLQYQKYYTKSYTPAGLPTDMTTVNNLVSGAKDQPLATDDDTDGYGLKNIRFSYVNQSSYTNLPLAAHYDNLFNSIQTTNKYSTEQTLHSVGVTETTYTKSWDGGISNSFNNTDKMSNLFDIKLDIFFDYYRQLSDFQTVLADDYFRRRKISLKSNYELNLHNLRTDTGIEWQYYGTGGKSKVVYLSESLVEWYDTIDYFIVGGGASGRETGDPWPGEKNGTGSGGASGHFKASLPGLEFKLNNKWGTINDSTTWRTNYVDLYVYDSASFTIPNLKTNKYDVSLAMIRVNSPNDNGMSLQSKIELNSTIKSKRVKVEIGCGGYANPGDRWNVNDGSPTSIGHETKTSNQITDSVKLVEVSGGIAKNGGANQGGNGTYWNQSLQEKGTEYYDGTSQVRGSHSNGGGGAGGVGWGLGGIGGCWNNTCFFYTGMNGEDFTGAGGGGAGGGLNNNSECGKECYPNGAGSGGSGFAILILTKTSSYSIPFITNYNGTALVSGFENQQDYNRPQIERKILVNSLNNLDFSGSPVVPYTFGGFLQSLRSWFT